MKRHLPLFVLCVLGVAACTVDIDNSSPPADTPAVASVEQWADARAKPIASLAMTPDDAELEATFEGVIGADVKLVGLGESAHGTHEFNQLRAKFFQYLVQSHGFRAIVPETGFIEAELVDRYVQGAADVTLEAALKDGLTHNMGPWEETRTLVTWMREYNQGKSPADRVHFGGKDLPVLGDTLTVPLVPVVKYLQKVDAAYAASPAVAEVMALAEKASAVTVKVDEAFRAKGAPGIDPDYLDAFTTISFEQLPAEEQKRLAQGVATVAGDVAKKSGEYTAASSEDDYAWNAQLTVVAQQLVTDLESRQEHPKIAFYDKAVELLAQGAPDVVVDKRPATDPASHTIDYTNAEHLRDYLVGRNSREEALAANVGWVQKRYGKVMNFAHNSHLSKVGMDKAVAFGVEIHDPGSNEGEFLARTYGPGYVLFGATNVDFEDEAGKPAQKFEGADVVAAADAPGTLEHDLAPLAKKHPVGFFVDLRDDAIDKNPTLKEGLGKRRTRHQNEFQEVTVRGNYDGLVVMSSVGPGRKLEIP